MADQSLAHPTEPQKNADWHACTTEQTQHALNTQVNGLSNEEVTQRQQLYGFNQLIAPKKRSAWMRFFMQFHNILLYIMLAASAVTAILGHWIDTFVLLAAVLVNAIIGFIQEGKAESAMDAIRSMISARATVIREGVRKEINALELVPGDLVILNSGDKIPADIRLTSARDLRVEEAALTGESVPIQKSTNVVASDAPLGDRTCMAYSGTVAVYGQASGIVVATGTYTELGKINEMLSSIENMTTPLLRQINAFGRALAIFILIFAAALFLFGVFLRGYSASDMFMMVIALTASAIPEGLPALITITLALGVQRMARQHAIVRNLPAVETLGSVSVICSDKTGTLTRNEMTVQRIVSSLHVYDVSGIGYAPQGTVYQNDQPVSCATDTILERIVRIGTLCNDAQLVNDTPPRIEGDPTEGALLVLGVKAGLTQKEAPSQWQRLDSIPFESEHRYMATYHQDEKSLPWILTKGAPERIFEMCSSQMSAHGISPLDIDYWRRMVTDTAAKGLRVLALGYKQAEPQAEQISTDDIDSGGFILAGLVGIIDPPREEAIAAIRECHQAGISVKMITGDHVETARAIGAQLNIGVDKPAMTGAEISVLDDQELSRVIMDVDVFARAAPEHKLRLVQAMQEQHQIVSMTGDGVNDAPALKRADVGVAMGQKGTEAAKEAADMVLTDDNFATIAKAVREGRTVYDNLKKFILFMLPTNGGEALVIIAAIFLQFTLPLTPAQVLWINMVTSCTLGLALAFEAAEPNIMTRPPRASSEKLLSGFFIWRIIMVSVLMMAAVLTLFLWELSHGTAENTARTIAVNTLVAAEMFYLLNSRHVYDTVLSREGLLGNKYVLLSIAACFALQLLFTYLPAFQYLFGSTALDLTQWLKVFAGGLFVFLAAELEKWIIRRFISLKPAA